MNPPKSHAATAFLLLLLIVFPCYVVRASPSPSFVWIESEALSAVSPAAIKTTVEDDGKPHLLSGGKWLKIDISADDVESQVPTEGLMVEYQFSVSTPGNYEIWNRIGFEAVRSPFDWRIDGGAWANAKSSDPTTDLEELQTWNPIAWLNLGSQSLSAGAHTLEIRLDKQYTNGKPLRILYASDAICLYDGNFRPNDQFRPDDNSWLDSRDTAAASNVFSIPTPQDDGQSSTPLTGDWLVARDDEMTLSDPASPIAKAPDVESLYWKSMAVPGNRDDEVPQWLYAHRYWLRTKIAVPAALSGHSFLLHFPAISMIATVFVNGTECGSTNTPFAAWDCDVTPAIKPGQTNDVWVGIKDWYYALADHGAVDRGHLEYIPTDWVTKFGPTNFTYPVWNHTENGILRTPSFVVAGPIYTSDVFAKPSVKNGSLGLDITINNTTDSPQTVTIQNAVTALTGGAPVKTFVPAIITVPPRDGSFISPLEPFPNAKLWWPDSPTQYDVVTTLSVAGKEVDRRTTKFGFREWTWSDGQFALNGVPWHGRADLVDYGRADDDAVATWRAHGQDMVRMWGEGNSSGRTPEDALDYYDSHGIVVRRTGIFDGEAARYQLVVGGQINRELFNNWQAQLLAWAKGERNHPSIFIWSIENEIAFINAKVYGLSSIVDPEESKVASALQEFDPTRPVMTDGGNALLDESMPVYGCHYIEAPFDTLPEGAYDVAALAHRQDWPITQSKPIFLGESFYANGDAPGDLATVGGESAFLGKAQERPAIGLAAKMLSEGLRWNGISFHYWIGGESESYYNSWQPVAVLCRQWDWTFGSGQSVARTLRIFNDTHDNSPITLRWTLQVGGTTVASATHKVLVSPGGSTTVDESLPLPQVRARQTGIWNLALLRSGNTVFTDAKPFSVLPRTTLAERHITTGDLSVFDPSGVVQRFLGLAAIEFAQCTTLETIPRETKVLVVGRNALSSQEATSSALAAYASSGHAVIVLEQNYPLKYLGLPSDTESTTDTGDIGFIVDPNNPAISGLNQADFFTWGNDGVLYADAYRAPASGGRSLVECGSGLTDSALVQFTPGSGLLLACQLEVGAKLSTCAVAQKLLVNMIEYGLSYKQTYRQTTVASSGNAQLTNALDAIHLDYRKDEDVLRAIGLPGSIAIVNATPANLATLASNRSLVDAFTTGGGWLLLNNVTPDGITSFDELVGVDHLIRPFNQEKVEFPPTRDPLTVGLSPAAIVMGNGKNIFDWEAGQYPDKDAFSYVVDTDDIAPFCTSPFFGWGLITNGFTQADGFWPLIINFPAPPSGTPFDIPINLPRPETVTSFTFVGNNNYWPQTKLDLQFSPTDDVSLDYDHGDITEPASPESFAIAPPRTVSSLNLKITGWDQRPGVAPNIGIDNIYLSIKRPADFAQRVRPMLNIGALVEYPHVAGGVVLCNIKFKDPITESNPENTGKKEAIIAAILRNLDAKFSGAKSIIAGAANLNYVPINLQSKVNQYNNDQGWFNNKQFTFADFPAGRQILAGVPYSIYNFTTSPVPTVIMLGGNGVPGNLPDSVTGIPINMKADALFFLQAARIDRPLSTDDVKNKRKIEIAEYVIHYADGTTENAPIDCQIGVDNYVQQTVNALPGAQIAWQHPYPTTGQTAVAYSMEWQNPHPEKEIQSVDLTYGDSRGRGVPCLIALTAATAN